jgi:hypothetical protein
MTEFDKLLEEYSNKSRKITRTERYPKGIALSREFLDALEAEYFEQHSSGNRNFHSNFLKALSFELDKFKDNPALIAKHSDEEAIVDQEVSVIEIPDDTPPLADVV